MSTPKIKLALIGSNGMLAQAVTKLAPAEYEVIPFDLPEFDMTDPELVEQVLTDVMPDVIVNCAAYTQVDKCESEEVLALKVNAQGPANLAAAAKTLDAVLIHISTDYVFDGSKTVPYVEMDKTCPQSAYGRTKLAGEQAIIDSSLERYFIIRTSWLYGPGGPNFVETMLRLGAECEELGIVDDQCGSPTYTYDLVNAIFNLLAIDNGSSITDHRLYGLYHFSNSGECSWYDFACEIFRQARENGMFLKVKKVTPIATTEYPVLAQRPAYSVFSKEKYIQGTEAVVPEWQSSLREYFKVRL